jgi:hypothetical protein
VQGAVEAVSLPLPTARSTSRNVALGATLVATGAAALWLAIAPRTPDLAAQSYRVGLFLRDGFALWDNNWYAGHHVPGYSLLFTPLGALLGMRVAGALAAIASALLFERLVSAHFGAAARWGAVWFALGTGSDLAIGRMTYALGTTVGLATLFALHRGHRRTAAVLAAASAAASPISGLYVALAGATLALTGRRRDGLVIGAPSVALVALLTIFFPEGGRQPFGFPSFVVAAVLTLAFVVFIGRDQRELRVGALLYLVAILASEALVTPMGGNVVRLGAVFGGPLLLCAIATSAPRLRAALVARAAVARAGSALLRAASPSSALALLILTLAAMFAWQWNAPVRELAKSVDDPVSHASYYAGVMAFLESHQQPLGRVEVPFTRSHWEAALMAPHLPLARGWEKQLDTRYDKLFFHHPLPRERYHHWLRTLGVRYVALPDAPWDPSSRDEVLLLEAGAPFLRIVWGDAHWTVYELTDPVRLANGPAQLTAMHDQDFTLEVTHPGSILVRIHFTPYWTVIAGSGCIAPGPEGFTRVTARSAGVLRVAARFSFAGALAGGQRCSRAVGTA